MPLGLAPEQVWVPSADAPDAYERRLADADGFDVLLLGCGAGDGHVAFLGPGSPRDGRTAIVELAESTRRDNLATFPAFESLDAVPRHGVSIGLGTIADARRVVVALSGEGKRAAASRLRSTQAFDPAWPASIVHDLPAGEIHLDAAAAA